MEYRGKQYLILHDAETNDWIWAVTIDDLATETGKAKTEPEAIIGMVLQVDRILRERRQDVIRLSPPS